MTTINEILTFFEAFAPTDSAMDFDNVGLLVGDKNAKVYIIRPAPEGV